MDNLYERIQDGVISLHTMSTGKLIELAQNTLDQRVRDMIGNILMYERTTLTKRKRVLK